MNFCILGTQLLSHIVSEMNQVSAISDWVLFVIIFKRSFC